jgi:hypothetical protein
MPFLFYSVDKIFKGHSLLFYSFLIVITFASLCKVGLLFLNDRWIISSRENSFFQASFFLCVPVYLFLEFNKKRFKRKTSFDYKFDKIHVIFPWLMVIIICVILLRLLFFVFIPFRG